MFERMNRCLLLNYTKTTAWIWIKFDTENYKFHPGISFPYHTSESAAKRKCVLRFLDHVPIPTQQAPRLEQSEPNVLSEYILQMFVDNSARTKRPLFSIVNVETIQFGVNRALLLDPESTLHSD